MHVNKTLSIYACIIHMYIIIYLCMYVFIYLCMYVCVFIGTVHTEKYSSHSSQHKRLTHRKIQISAVRLQRFFWATTGTAP